MTKYYDKQRKGMKKGAGGKFYYPKRRAKTKQARKQTSSIRQPFVEQKQKDEVIDSATMTTILDQGGHVYVPQNWTQMTQGDQMDQINGRWIYSKWLVTQMTVSYDQMKDYNFPFNMKCRYGWVKLNLNPSVSVAGSLPPATPLAVEIGDLERHVLNVLKHNFNPTTLLPQKARDVLVIKEFVIKNNPRLLEDATSTSITTFRNDKHLSFKWSPQRKIQYQKCQNSAGQQFFECNQKNWIPFVQFLHVPAGTEDHPQSTELPKLAVGTRHYFTDS
jgi:hypothetical protein